MDLQPNDFKFTLLSEGKTWELPQAPDQWEESSLQWSRSDLYFGIIKSFSVPLRFVLDGAWLLRRAMYLEGIDADCILRIELLNRSTWEYELLYEGSIDFSTFDDTLTAVESTLMEKGLSASISAFDKTEYEFPVLPDDTVQVRLPGMDVVETAAGVPYYSQDNYKGYFPGISITLNELFTEKVEVREQQFQLDPSVVDPFNWWIRGNETGGTDTRIFGSIVYRFNRPFLGSFRPNYQVQIVTESGTVLFVIYDTTNQLVPNINFDMTVNFDFAYNLADGQKLFLRVQGPNFPFEVDSYFRIVAGEVKVSYNLTTEPTIIRAYKPKTLLRKILGRMHDEEVNIQSALLDQWDNLLITSGDAIRTIDEALIKTNFSDFFQSINAVLNAGISISENTLTLEQKSFFFRPALPILDLGDSPKDVHVRPSQRFMFNTIKAGYPDDDYEVDQGREEYNSGQIWSTNIRRIQKELNLQSIYRADQYGIEQLRIASLDEARDNINAKDKKNDNEVFFIHALKEIGEDGIYNVYNVDQYLRISGISNRSSSYNLEITPKKNLLRHSDYLAGALYQNSDYIKFEKADKNADLVTTSLSGVTIGEKDLISVSSLGTPLFIPFEVELVTDLKFDAWRLLQTAPSGYIRFEWREHEFYGFILEVSQNIERNAERTITLLLTPDNDITKLID